MVAPLRMAAAGEAGTGMVLTLFPGLVVPLLFGVDPAGAGLAMARIAGMALVALGIACWPGAHSTGRRERTAMVAYSTLAAIYLGGLGVDGGLRGPLLWPVVVLHLILSAMLVSTRTIRHGS